MEDRPGRKRRLLRIGLLAALVAAPAYVVAAGSVSKDITDADRQAIATLRADAECTKTREFAAQLRCARFIQRAVQTAVPDMTCANNGERIEPLPFLKRGYGCCYDRARFMSKALEHYGLRTRHVFLIDTSRYGRAAYLVPNVLSHAATEVLTARGWMGVDSNKPWILITRNGQPVTYGQVRNLDPKTLAQPIPKELPYSAPLATVYGLYSRHGRFHGPNLPAPEINYPEFIRYNLLSRT